MILRRLSLYRYCCPLRKAITLSNLSLSQRDVLLLKAQIQTSKSEYTSWAEVSPLPGYSCESLAQCEHQLKTYFCSFEGSKLTIDALSSNTNRLFPSVSWGLASLLRGNTHPRNIDIKKCSLLVDNEHAKLAGSAPVKLKVGARSIAEDIERIKSVLDNPMFNGKLRLDANQQWHPKDIETFQKTDFLDRIEWFEDPLRPEYNYQAWHEILPVPYALDERLYKNSGLPEKTDLLKALILKPALLGYGNTLKLTRFCQEQGLNAIYSSSFETPVGFNILCSWAKHYAPNEYHGLDTMKYFSTTVFSEVNCSALKKLADFRF